MNRCIETNIKELKLKYAKEKDTPQILEFIKELAIYEDMLEQVVATEEILRESLFEKKQAEVLIAEYEGVAIGFALFFHNFSTFLGRSGIYLEDLFIKEEVRKKGIGKEILSVLARIALERNCGRLEWSCLDWNEPSIKFYKSKGAVQMEDWTTYRVTDKALVELAKGIK
jgi:GNAT superfamily N-acetyltransferase